MRRGQGITTETQEYSQRIKSRYPRSDPGIIYPNKSQDIQGSLAVNGMFQGFFLTENFCQSENVISKSLPRQTAPSFWICFLNHNFHVYKQYVSLFECGKCEVRNNKIIDLNGHLRFIHSDMFRQPSATILIEIQITTEHQQKRQYRKQ